MMMVMAAVLNAVTMVMMDLFASIVCKHAEQLHRVVGRALVELETRRCRQINRQHQRYRDIACELVHLIKLFDFGDERHTGIEYRLIGIAQETVGLLELGLDIFPAGCLSAAGKHSLRRGLAAEHLHKALHLALG